MGGNDGLTGAEINRAAVNDWRQLAGPIRSRYRTGDFAAGLAFVTQVGEAAEQADLAPHITLSGTDVIITLGSGDGGVVTARDITFARTVSSIAADADLTADPTSVMQMEFALDTTAGSRISPFYAALLGDELDHGPHAHGGLVDPTGQAVPLWWQQPKETSRFPLPATGVPQTWHPDIWVAHDEAEHRIAAALAAGGRLVSDSAAPSYWVLEDPDGNRCCVCAPMEEE
ncbi:VOC family protein [Brevibacterium ammoniilyticum]|uniref:Putative pterin-4-alpha-carbinolamine dehydratase n=1 Tax=Brevibacterium ammoniilyticum TaxID=1046555 RepID=A0ABP9U591_9MICO